MQNSWPAETECSPALTAAPVGIVAKVSTCVIFIQDSSVCCATVNLFTCKNNTPWLANFLIRHENLHVLPRVAQADRVTAELVDSADKLNFTIVPEVDVV